MKLRKPTRLAVCGAVCVGALIAWQRPFRELPGIEYHSFERPADWEEKTEWAFARLMFPPGPLNGYRGRDLDWHTGISLWSQDFPRADRHFSLAVRRLTRLHVRSVEQLVNLDEGDQYDWPWLYAVQVGEWGLTDLHGIQPRPVVLIAFIEIDDLFDGPHVDTGEAPHGQREVAIGARKVLRPERVAGVP